MAATGGEKVKAKGSKLKLKKSKIKMYDFSDESDDDFKTDKNPSEELETTLAKLKMTMKDKNLSSATSNLNSNEPVLTGNDMRRRSELPSFSGEDFDIPFGESTRMSNIFSTDMLNCKERRFEPAKKQAAKYVEKKKKSFKKEDQENTNPYKPERKNVRTSKKPTSFKDEELPTLCDFELPVGESTRISNMFSTDRKDLISEENIPNNPKSVRDNPHQKFSSIAAKPRNQEGVVHLQNPSKKDPILASNVLRRKSEVPSLLLEDFSLPESESTRMSNVFTWNKSYRKEDRTIQSSKEQSVTVLSTSARKQTNSSKHENSLTSLEGRVRMHDVKNRYSELLSRLPGNNNTFHQTMTSDLTLLDLQASPSSAKGADMNTLTFPNNTMNVSSSGGKKNLLGSTGSSNSKSSLQSADTLRTRKSRVSHINPLLHGAATLMNIKLEEESISEEGDYSSHRSVSPKEGESTSGGATGDSSHNFVNVQDNSAQVNMSNTTSSHVRSPLPLMLEETDLVSPVSGSDSISPIRSGVVSPEVINLDDSPTFVEVEVNDISAQANLSMMSENSKSSQDRDSSRTSQSSNVSDGSNQQKTNSPQTCPSEDDVVEVQDAWVQANLSQCSQPELKEPKPKETKTKEQKPKESEAKKPKTKESKPKGLKTKEPKVKNTKSKKKKATKVKLDFNFSDESSDECVSIEGSSGSKSTIVSSDQSSVHDYSQGLQFIGQADPSVDSPVFSVKALVSESDKNTLKAGYSSPNTFSPTNCEKKASNNYDNSDILERSSSNMSGSPERSSDNTAFKTCVSHTSKSGSLFDNTESSLESIHGLTTADLNNKQNTEKQRPFQCFAQLSQLNAKDTSNEHHPKVDTSYNSVDGLANLNQSAASCLGGERNSTLFTTAPLGDPHNISHWKMFREVLCGNSSDEEDRPSIQQKNHILSVASDSENENYSSKPIKGKVLIAASDDECDSDVSRTDEGRQVICDSEDDDSGDDRQRRKSELPTMYDFDLPASESTRISNVFSSTNRKSFLLEESVIEEADDEDGQESLSRTPPTQIAKTEKGSIRKPYSGRKANLSLNKSSPKPEGKARKSLTKSKQARECSEDSGGDDLQPDGGDLSDGDLQPDASDSHGKSSIRREADVTEPEHKRQQEYDDSSSDDDFEGFLSKVKSQCVIEVPQEELPSMEDFVVSEDDDQSSESGEDTDEELLHVRVDMERDRQASDLAAPRGSHSESDSNSDSDSDAWVPDVKTPAKTPAKHRTKSLRTPRSVAFFNDDSFSDDADDFKPTRPPFRTPSVTSLPPPRTVVPGAFKTPARPRPDRQIEAKAAMTAPRLTTRLDDDSGLLKSLTADFPEARRHPQAARYLRQFKNSAVKNELTTKLFDIFNKTVFEGKLPQDLQIEWNPRYLKTAGTFSYRGRGAGAYEAKIKLSVKVCDSPERVRDTLAHELCHAAVKLINGLKEGHGPVWKAWAHKVNKAYSFMPVISRCHDYTIQTKYTYQCVQCNYRIQRHSKSLDTENKVCGHCKGQFQVYLTKDLQAGTPATPRTPRTPNRFAMFVKESYSAVKGRQAGVSHKEVMNILSREFASKNKVTD